MEEAEKKNANIQPASNFSFADSHISDEKGDRNNKERKGGNPRNDNYRDNDFVPNRSNRHR